MVSSVVFVISRAARPIGRAPGCVSCVLYFQCAMRTGVSDDLRFVEADLVGFRRIVFFTCLFGERLRWISGGMWTRCSLQCCFQVCCFGGCICILDQVAAMSSFLHVVVQPLLAKFIFEFEARILWLVPGEDRRRLLSDRDFMFMAVKQNGLALEFASDMFRSELVFVMAAVKQNGCALRFCTALHRTGRWPAQPCTAVAVRQDGLALQYAAKELRRCSFFVTLAIRQNGTALQFAAKKLRSDRDLVMVAVWCNGMALKFASKELRSDLEIVQRAVRQNGLALEFAAEEFRSDLEVVCMAVNHNVLSLVFASEDLQKKLSGVFV